MKYLKTHVSGRFAIEVDKLHELNRKFYIVDIWALARTELVFDKESSGKILSVFWMNEVELAILEKTDCLKQTVYEVNLRQSTATETFSRDTLLTEQYDKLENMKDLVVKGEFFLVSDNEVGEWYPYFSVLRWSDGRQLKLSLLTVDPDDYSNFAVFGSKLYWIHNERNTLECYDLEKCDLNTCAEFIPYNSEYLTSTVLQISNFSGLMYLTLWEWTVQQIGAKLYLSSDSCRSVYIVDLFSSVIYEHRKVEGTHLMQIKRRIVVLSSYGNNFDIIDSFEPTPEKVTLRELASKTAIQKTDLAYYKEYLRIIFA